MRRLVAACLLALVAGCARKPPPPPHVVLGAAYQADGVWRYPRESYSLDETGIAAIQPDDHARLTTDGEAFDQKTLAAAHPTVQLPAIARVTDLDTGKSVLVRINDRGPAAPARAIAVTRRTAALLGFSPEGVARVRVELVDDQSRAAVASLGGGPTAPLAIEAAPRAAITTAELPPPGSGRSAGAARPLGPAAVADAPVAAAPPLRLPERVEQGTAAPGQLIIFLGQFGRREFAAKQAARSGDGSARVEATRLGRETAYRALVGPFATVPDADAALKRIIASGVVDARIVIE